MNSLRNCFLMLDETEYDRWIRASKGTLRSARGDLQRKDYNWACFKAQQAAEFAVKALLHGLGLPAYGHSISGLISTILKDLDVKQEVIQAAKTLDKYYVPARYPSAWAEGIPEEYYTKQDAENAIRCAEEVIGWVEDSWRLLKGERE